jgi:hypothetical protein
VDVSSLIGNRCQGGAKAQVKWETERPADGRDAANDVGTIDRAVPVSEPCNNGSVQLK